MSEYTEVEQPFLKQLESLGWNIIDQGPDIPQNPADSLRQSFRQMILPEIFAESIKKLNVTSSGEFWLTNRQLQDLQDQIYRQPNRTLLEANEQVQKLLFKAQVDVNEVTGEQDPVVTLIDFNTPENNLFHAINQFRIDTPGCVKSFIIPDIVLFLNGLPFIVVECKKGGATCSNPMYEAFIQLQRYRNGRKETRDLGLKEGEPRLFYSNLFLIRTTGLEADYGTITSGMEHFFPWKTQYPQDDSIASDWNAQKQLINGMLNKDALLKILRSSTVFMDTDSGPRIKVVCRYQQYRAACKIIDRLRAGSTADDKSGVVWHTQGSGKSLTMVFVARMIKYSGDLSDYKIILINDRVDLEEQLSETAALIGGRVNIIENTDHLRQHLSTDSSDVNMVMAHKFQERDQALPWKVAEALQTYNAIPSGKTFGIVNDSEKIILMIDEAHRTQSSDLGDNIFEAFPNAARVAFTGTPLITERHGEKKTYKRFGDYIDTYKLMDAVHDGATLQILYEGRTADAALNDKHGFETAFEDLFIDRSEEELLAIKKKYGATGDILEAEERIKAISNDMVNHYVENILPNGFKAQVVCHSKLAAVRYQSAIDQALEERIKIEERRDSPDSGLIKKLKYLKTAVVISGDGTNEAAFITKSRKEARAMNAVDNFCRDFDFDDPDKTYTGIAFLIVCDMLLTGFDAPVEQVMYIDKKIKEHTLLQAIARTNRIKKGKQRGYIVDYIGLANHLTDALTIYAVSDEQQELAEGLKNINSELPILEERYNRLLQLFESNRIENIKDYVEGSLASMEEDAQVVHAAVKLLKNEKLRADFDVFMKKFMSSMDVILPNAAAGPYRVPAKRFGYILRVSKERYKDDTLNLGNAGEKIKALINEHLISLGINPKIPPVELLADDFMEKLNIHSEKNLEAKASEMEHAIRKHCTVHHDEDPAFYKSLSEKVDNLIDLYKDNWETLLEELEKIRGEAAEGRKTGHDDLSKEAAVFYDYIISDVIAEDSIGNEDQKVLRTIMNSLVDTIGQDIVSNDYWSNPDKQKETRSKIKRAIMLSNIAELKEKREKIAIEIMKLAKNRHNSLIEETQ